MLKVDYQKYGDLEHPLTKEKREIIEKVLKLIIQFIDIEKVLSYERLEEVINYAVDLNTLNKSKQYFIETTGCHYYL